MRKISFIVLHHTATAGLGDGSVEFNTISVACQKKRIKDYPFYYCDYHYGIGPTGGRFSGQQEADPAWHCGDDQINNESIAVACIGNFEENQMPIEQEKTLIKLVVSLRQKYPLAQVKLHKEIVATLCPGRFFPARKVMDATSQKRTVFSDVYPGQRFYGAIQYVVGQEIMRGDSAGEGTFRPNDPVTRGELAQVLWNLAQK